jgi:tetratricopeptide (TPR) repeat protein
MRIRLLTSWLLFACLGAPLYLCAQSQPYGHEVSIRELSIPSKAHHEFEQGMARLAEKDAAGSLLHFQRAISEYAGYYEAYDRIGAANLRLWHVPEAEQAFRKSIEVSGGQFAHPLLALGAILTQRDQFAEAESVIRKGLGLAPDYWRGYYYLGLALFGLNRFEDSEGSTREALRRKADFPEGYLLLADIHRHEEDFHALLSDLDEYLKLAPDGPASAGVKALRDSVKGMIPVSQTSSALILIQP